jgi:Arc/MetJ family transcription regulator
MRTNIEINQELIEEIMKIIAIITKKEAVHLALEEYLRRLKLDVSMSSFDGYWPCYLMVN